MPPVTRTQAKSLPREGQNDATKQTPPTLPAVAKRRRHQRKLEKDPIQAASGKSATTDDIPLQPPRFTIDLSLPPSQRYAEVCHALRDEMRGLQSLFDEVVGGFLPWLPSVGFVVAGLRWGGKCGVGCELCLSSQIVILCVQIVICMICSVRKRKAELRREEDSAWLTITSGHLPRNRHPQIPPHSLQRRPRPTHGLFFRRRRRAKSLLLPTLRDQNGPLPHSRLGHGLTSTSPRNSRLCA